MVNFMTRPDISEMLKKNYADYNGRWRGVRKAASVARRRNNV